MRRVVEPELLDVLPPGDSEAAGSRADLRRLNHLLGHVGYLTREYRSQHEATRSQSRPLRIVELGAGDGTLLLRIARAWSVLGVKAEATLIDRQHLVSDETRRGFAEVCWSAETVAGDVFDWLERPGPVADVMLANLFLHHFQDSLLGNLFRLAAARTKLFLACEPCRSPFALAAARCVSILGCNGVTRHDAVVSVRAGFVGHELSVRWPKSHGWALSEKPVGLFSHGFVAKRNV